jgi:MFS family permease
MEMASSLHPRLWLCDHQRVCYMPSDLEWCMLTSFFRRTTTMLTPGLEPLTEQFKSNEGDISTWILTAPTFWTSAAAFIAVAGTDVWGRRPFYIWSVVMLALCNFAGHFSTTFPMLAIARTAGGLFSAPLFTLLTATISDIFFVHQRGKSIAIWNLMLNSGAQIG